MALPPKERSGHSSRPRSGSYSSRPCPSDHPNKPAKWEGLTGLEMQAQTIM
ncbi:hypothetical protein M408DRAFT_26945 [Serendipita vermifera MAFF 305830]|uniref:Uncharacterized protein n=1 Tax=Serendipita vermifera MAFF 305830 TaxID=933852 RepID=A0A0C3AIK2_SERVB|nr:hypothetical protein M408DRAFT_26945 [Serendipita vermifera MAFF 305830]